MSKRLMISWCVDCPNLSSGTNEGDLTCIRCLRGIINDNVDEIKQPLNYRGNKNMSKPDVYNLDKITEKHFARTVEIMTNSKNEFYDIGERMAAMVLRGATWCDEIADAQHEDD